MAMKVHVTLREAFATTLEARRAALERVIQAVGLRHFNQRRFERYGIITGELDDDQLPTLQGLTEVQSVEQDSLKSAL
jgi:hypothetical protein